MKVNEKKTCDICGAVIPTESAIDYISENGNKFCYKCGSEMLTNNDKI